MKDVENRHSYPSSPLSPSSPTNLLLLFPQLVSSEAGAIPLGQRGSRRKIEDDGRPLTEIERDAPCVPPEEQYSQALKSAIITIALCMAIFLVALVSLFLPVLWLL